MMSRKQVGNTSISINITIFYLVKKHFREYIEQKKYEISFLTTILIVQSVKFRSIVKFLAIYPSIFWDVYTKQATNFNFASVHFNQNG